MTTLFGRKIIHTTLDDIPRAFRACPGHIAANAREIQAVERNAPEDSELVAYLLEIAITETARDAQMMALPRPKKRRPARAFSPSTRLAMLGAVVGR